MSILILLWLSIITLLFGLLFIDDALVIDEEVLGGDE